VGTCPGCSRSQGVGFIGEVNDDNCAEDHLVGMLPTVSSCGCHTAT
jgi:hypothetical protein